MGAEFHAEWIILRNPTVKGEVDGRVHVRQPYELRPKLPTEESDAQ